ncbi:hypothetical protein MMC20_001078 [Loxospora ochrophaea]|nr:hypothetical protein [Loxospora ochrophaea]
MATTSKIHLLSSDGGEFHVPGLTVESAVKASEILQENHEIHHIFFNQKGFHNHIVHHILTAFALGASPESLQIHYDNNKNYQRPPEPLDPGVVKELHDPTLYMKYLGNERYYRDYVSFFKGEIDKKGYEEVINEYVLKGDERADDMLARMFSSIAHPIIHFGFGVEFKQPAIIAEGLAEAAVHKNYILEYFHRAESQAKSSKSTTKSIVSLLDEIRANKRLSSAGRFTDWNTLRDGVLARAQNDMLDYASQWTASPDTLEERTAEMTNAVAYYGGGAQHPPKQIKFDFNFIHYINASIFFTSFLKQPWISPENKVRLLEWKVRLDLAVYAAQGSPEPLLDLISRYKPKKQPSSGDQWTAIFQRANEVEDDGHANKLVRALAHGEMICKPYEENEKFRITGKMWQQLGNMAIDSVEDTGNHWVRGAGFDEAWEKFDDRPAAHL